MNRSNMNEIMLWIWQNIIPVARLGDLLSIPEVKKWLWNDLVC